LPFPTRRSSDLAETRDTGMEACAYLDSPWPPRVPRAKAAACLALVLAAHAAVLGLLATRERAPAQPPEPVSVRLLAAPSPSEDATAGLGARDAASAPSLASAPDAPNAAGQRAPASEPDPAPPRAESVGPRAEFTRTPQVRKPTGSGPEENRNVRPEAPAPATRAEPQKDAPTKPRAARTPSRSSPLPLQSPPSAAEPAVAAKPPPSATGPAPAAPLAAGPAVPRAAEVPPAASPPPDVASPSASAPAPEPTQGPIAPDHAPASAGDAARAPAAPGAEGPGSEAGAAATTDPAAPARTQPRFDAAYLDNPKPEYPRLARRLGEEGTVLLNVYVAADGSPEKIELRASSGSPRLDQAARETVSHWKFVPAREGGRAVGAWIVVPIRFVLQG